MEHREILGLLRAWGCRTIVDIGANRGQFALAARAFVPEAMIYSFEPLTAPSARFRSVFHRDARVRLHQSAIGPSQNAATMHVSGRDHSSSLLPIGELQEQLYPGTAEVGSEVIHMERLADVLSPSEIETLAALKIDVQGYELETLRGCEGLLHLFSCIYAECSFAELYEGQALAPEVIRFLDEHGFRMAGIYNVSYDQSGSAVQADFLFLKAMRHFRQCDGASAMEGLPCSGGLKQPSR